MDYSLTVPTDAASIWVFDPEVLSDYKGDDLEEFEFSQIGGVVQGQFFGFSVGSDGVYRIRVTDETLTQDERDYAVSRLNLRVESKSGVVCVGGYGFQGTEKHFPSVRVTPGKYEVEIYEILWSVSPEWWREDYTVPPDAPSDFVMVFNPLPSEETPFKLPDEFRLETLYLPQFDGDPDFLFESTSRRVGAETGMVLTSTVVKVLSNPPTLRLKQCGPDGFPAELPDYSGLEWRDRVRFRVVEVDRNGGVIRGEFIEKVVG